MGAIKIDIKNLIDQRNQNLYNHLIDCGWQISTVRLDPDGEDHWSVRIAGTSATIYAGKDVNHIPSFTHELLHILMVEEGNYNVGYWLNIFVLNPKITWEIKKYLSRNDLSIHLSQIENVLMHARMIDIFRTYTFADNEFLYDFDQSCTDIDNHGEFNLVDGNNIHFKNLIHFLVFYFKMKFHPDPTKTEHCLSIYEQRYGDNNKELIDQLDCLTEEWLSHTITNNGTFFKTLFEILEAWKGIRSYIVH